MYTYESRTPQKTFELAQALGKLLTGGEMIALEGELGAGKTLFVQGLARGLGVSEPVTSPTFTLLNLYEGRLTLAHFDIYRLPVPEALEEIGYEEYFYGSGVAAVEWSDLVKSYLPEQYLQVNIRRDYNKEQGEGRLLTFIPHGAQMEMLVEELAQYAGAGD